MVLVRRHRRRTPVYLQPLAVVTERMTTRAAAAIVAFDIVALGALVVVMMDTRAGLDRVIACYLRHLISPHFQHASL